jgi:hypothetical protein
MASAYRSRERGARRAQVVQPWRIRRAASIRYGDRKWSRAQSARGSSMRACRGYSAGIPHF